MAVDSIKGATDYGAAKTITQESENALEVLMGDVKMM